MKGGRMELYGTFMSSYWRDEKSGESFFEIKVPFGQLSSLQFIKEKISLKDCLTKNKYEWHVVTCKALGKGFGIVPFRSKTPVIIKGSFKENRDTKYGWEFIVEEAKEGNLSEKTDTLKFLADTYDEIAAGQITEYLVSGEFTGIVFSDAVFIAKHLVHTNRTLRDKGDRKSLLSLNDFAQANGTFSFLKEHTKIKDENIRQFIRKIDRLTSERRLFSRLSIFGVSCSESAKLYKLYGHEAEYKLYENPYKIGDVIGLSFIMQDYLNKSFGKSGTDPNRLSALGKEALNMTKANGHIWVNEQELASNINYLIQKGAYEPSKTTMSGVLPFSKKIISELNGRYFDKHLYDAEGIIRDEIIRIYNACKDFDEPFDISLIDYAKKECKVSYGKQQSEAFPIMLRSRGFKILTGGPGTGKTTTVKGILLAYEKMHPDHVIKLCAPTGRAAQRMSESTGRPAVTVHRLLDIRPTGSMDHLYQSSNIKIEADLIVVDEVSMMDTELTADFLRAVKNGTSVIFVGDIHQLESVGPGNVLYDLLQSSDSLIGKCMLTEVFRQGADSPIIQNSININNGISNMLITDDFKVIKVKDGEEALEAVNKLTGHLYNKENPFETQVLCPVRAGEAGILKINKELQKILNPGKAGLTYGKTAFKVNDKVLMTSNNYELGYYNGDIGVIKEIKDAGMTIMIRDEEIRIERDLLGDVQLSYGMTIHKSQGSEFPNVIVVMPKNQKSMLVRNLLYTGVTRAKKKVWIIDEDGAMGIACRTDHTGCRHTLLGEYMDNLKEKKKNIGRVKEC